MPTKREKLQQLRQSSFIGRQRELNLFRSLLPLDRTTPIDVLVIYGMGGIGKSELLDQFRLLARDEAVPVAKIDPQAYPTIFDFLVAMYKQLNSQISFPQFEEGLKRHQEIESRIIGHADVPKTVLRMFARGAHAALKLAPGVNLVAEIVSSEQIESAMSAVYNLVGRKEADFWMRPDDELTDRLVADLNAYSTQQRLVLLIDTYELIGTFDEWVRERLFAGLGEHALLVIAGRHRLTGKGWQEYAALMRQVALQPLSTSEAQVYLYKKGIIDPQVASAMVDYADGHPLTLMLLSELADHVQVADLAHTPERRQVIHSLLERITQNVAASLRAALEMCAVLRIVNEDSLARDQQPSELW